MKTLIPILNHLESILNNIKTNTKTIFYNQEIKNSQFQIIDKIKKI